MPKLLESYDMLEGITSLGGFISLVPNESIQEAIQMVHCFRYLAYTIM